MLSGGCKGRFVRERTRNIGLQQFVLDRCQAAEENEANCRGNGLRPGWQNAGTAARRYGTDREESRLPGPWAVAWFRGGIAFAIAGQPPVIWRYQVAWCCLAQARVTVPDIMARMVPFVQIAALNMDEDKTDHCRP